MLDTASKLPNDLLEIYRDKCNKYSDARKNKMNRKYNPKTIFISNYDYSLWLENEELTDKEESSDVPPISLLEGNEEKKEGKGLKILTPNKLLLTTHPIFLAEIKDGNNSYKLKNEIRQIVYRLYQDNKITKKGSNSLIKSL